MKLIYIATGLAVFGYINMICFCRKSHRYQLYSTKITGKQSCNVFMAGERMTEHMETVDEQAVVAFTYSHPLFFDLEPVLEWIEKLTKHSILFANGKTLPPTCGDLADFTIDFFFSEVKKRLTFYDQKPKRLEDDLQARLDAARIRLDVIQTEVRAMLEATPKSEPQHEEGWKEEMANNLSDADDNNSEGGNNDNGNNRHRINNNIIVNMNMCHHNRNNINLRRNRRLGGHSLWVHPTR